MVKGMLGKKIEMTQIFSGDEEIPVTVVMAGPCFVVQKKTEQKDGYDSIQLGFLEKKPKRVNKALKGHYGKAGTPFFYHLREFKGEGLEGYKIGQKIECAEVFEEGDFVDITGTTKGKGFTGVMKRWNFAGGPASHGSMHNRAPGSIGQCSDPSRVFKGMKMAGHDGNRRATTQNLKIMGVVSEGNLLLIKGAIPGPVNGLLEIRKALKKEKRSETSTNKD
jgi:large subunit ribosomal protein L3